MSHGKLKELVFALRDEEALEPASRALAQEHLAGCGECRAAVEGWEKASKTLFAKAAVEPSEEFTRAVLRKVRSMEEPASWMSRLAALFPRLVAASALAAAVALMLAPRRTAPPAPQAPQTEASTAQSIEAEDETVYEWLEAGAEENSGLGTAIEEYFL